jgi:hypothetical protein
MTRVRRQDEVMQQLPPVVARFVGHVFKRLEQENVFDAPGVISGVLRHMRVSDSDLIRHSAAHTELVLKQTFARTGCQVQADAS